MQFLTAKSIFFFDMNQFNSQAMRAPHAFYRVSHDQFSRRGRLREQLAQSCSLEWLFTKIFSAANTLEAYSFKLFSPSNDTHAVPSHNKPTAKNINSFEQYLQYHSQHR